MTKPKFKVKGAYSRLTSQKKARVDQLLDGFKIYLEILNENRKRYGLDDMGGSRGRTLRGKDSGGPSSLKSLPTSEPSVVSNNVVGEDARGNHLAPKPIPGVSQGKKSKRKTPA